MARDDMSPATVAAPGSGRAGAPYLPPYLLLVLVGQLLRATYRDRPPLPAPPEPGLVIDRAGREAQIGGTRIELTFLEFELLNFLASNPGTVFSRSQLLRHVWRRFPGETTRTVDVHVHRLRRKLGGRHGRCLVTMRQVGYKFIPPGTQSATPQ